MTVGSAPSLPLELPTAGGDAADGTSAARPDTPPSGRPLLTVIAYGKPAAQGSKRAFRNQHTGRIQQVESSKNAAPWREAVKYAALQAIADREGTGDFFATLAGPAHVETTFTFARPKSHYRTGRNAHLLKDDAPKWPTGKPDIEKLVRLSRDSLTDAGVWCDDAQVVREYNEKVYVGEPGSLSKPGLSIVVWAVS